MPLSPDLPEAHATALCDELAALRAELRCILEHPAITPVRRQAAESLIAQCCEPARLGHWLTLAVAECGRWEERTLAMEASSKSPGCLPG